MVTTTLGISPGTRSIGIAVLANDDLIEWQVKCFKGKWSKEKMLLIVKAVEKLCDHFRIDALAVKEVSPLRCSANLTNLAKSLNTLARKRKLLCSRYTLDDLKRNLSPNGKHSLEELMEFITEKYPILRREYLKERNNLTPYYLKMFEAITAARILAQKLEDV